MGVPSQGERKEKVCNFCGWSFPANALYFNRETRYYKATDGLRGICIICTRKKRNAKRAFWRIQWQELLQSRGMNSCLVCGYNHCFAAIDFHHLDPGTKEIEPAKLFNMEPSETNFKRLDGCVCLCANCHREYHYNRRKEDIGDGSSK